MGATGVLPHINHKVVDACRELMPTR